ncbi:MAG: hypothetical protein KJ666_07835 [Bacteroidetes bacterium]|nr:hypothetical protein [Bacteroidota bacterium]MBU2586448.1 hypothetical protein [Bacteroidota bacterium]
MKYKKILYLLIIVFQTNLFSQSGVYSNKIFLSGKDYFWNLVFDGWEGKHYDWSLDRKVYVYDDSLRGFREYLNLPGVCQRVVPNIYGNKLALIFVPTSGTDFGEHHLLVLDSIGKKVIEIANVFDFEWLPSKDTLIFVSGEYSETNEIGGFTPTGTWILDLKTKESKKISNEGYWVSIDERSETIFIDGYWKVYAYDYSKGILRETDLKGNRFSSDRKYYYRTIGGYWPIKVYETATNSVLTISAIDTIAQYAQWLPGGSHSLVVGDPNKEKKIVNIKTGTVIGKISGTILGFDEKRRQHLVFKDKRHLKHLTKSKLEWVKIE